MQTIKSAQPELTLNRSTKGGIEGTIGYDGDMESMEGLFKTLLPRSSVLIRGDKYIITNSSIKRRAGNKASLSLSIAGDRSTNRKEDGDEEVTASPEAIRTNAKISVTMTRDNIAIEEKAYEGLTELEASLLGNMYKIVSMWKDTPRSKQVNFIVTDKDYVDHDLKLNPYFSRISQILKWIERGTTTYASFHPVVSVKFVAIKPPELSRMGTYIVAPFLGDIDVSGFFMVLTGCNAEKIEDVITGGTTAYNLDGSINVSPKEKIDTYWNIDYVYEGFRYLDSLLYKPLGTGGGD